MLGLKQCIITLGAGITPFSPMLFILYKVYPGELVRSSGTDITLDDVLTILDEHYNNVKALDALNQELFQLCMGEKRQYQTGGAPVETTAGSCGIIPRTFSSGPCS